MFSSTLQTKAIKIFNFKSLPFVTSVGIHVLFLFLAFPILSKFSHQEKSTGDRRVDVVELSPTDRNRLPNLSQDLINTPSYPDISTLDNSLYNSSSLPPSSPSTSSIPNLPPPPSYDSTITFGNNLPITTPPVASLPPTAPPTGTTNSYVPPQTPYSTPNTPSLPQETQQTPTSSNLKRPYFPAVRENPYKVDQQYLPILRGNEQTEAPQQTAIRDGRENPTRESAQALQERRIRRLVAENIQGAESLVADKENTSDEEARENEVNWRVRAKVGQPTEVTLTGTYPKAACMRKLEGTTVYGVLVDTQGKMTNAPYRPYLIKSAGYPVLNQQALNEIRANNFTNQSGKAQAHRIVVNFEYDAKVCPSIAIAQPETTEKKPTPTAEEAQKKPQTSTPLQTQPRPDNLKPTATEQPKPENVTPTAPRAAEEPQQKPQTNTPLQTEPRPDNLKPTATEQPKPENVTPTAPRAAEEAQPKPEAAETIPTERVKPEATDKPQQQLEVPAIDRPERSETPAKPKPEATNSDSKIPQNQPEATTRDRALPEIKLPNQAPTNSRKTPLQPLGNAAPRKD
jgi:TonB family protein